MFAEMIQKPWSMAGRLVEADVPECIMQVGQAATPTYMGIEIPEEIIRQLKMMTATPVERLSQHEIHAAVLAFEDDANLLEDHAGHGLLDKFQLDAHEIAGHEFGQYEHNFEALPTIHSVEDMATEAASAFAAKAEDVPEYMASFSFVERYLSEMGQQVMSLV